MRKPGVIHLFIALVAAVMICLPGRAGIVDAVVDKLDNAKELTELLKILDETRKLGNQLKTVDSTLTRKFNTVHESLSGALNKAQNIANFIDEINLVSNQVEFTKSAVTRVENASKAMVEIQKYYDSSSSNAVRTALNSFNGRFSEFESAAKNVLRVLQTDVEFLEKLTKSIAKTINPDASFILELREWLEKEQKEVIEEIEKIEDTVEVENAIAEAVEAGVSFGEMMKDTRNDGNAYSEQLKSLPTQKSAAKSIIDNLFAVIGILFVGMVPFLIFRRHFGGGEDSNASNVWTRVFLAMLVAFLVMSMLKMFVR